MTFSVALCTHNGEQFIKEQLESIIQQSVPVNEIVICDDASTDNTAEIIRQFQLRYPDLIQFHQNKVNTGAIKNFEKCIGLCKGEIIFLCDQDDVWYPEKARIQSNYLENKKEALLVFTNGDLIDEEGNSLSSTLWEKWGFTESLREAWKNNDVAFDHLLRNKNKVTGATIAFKAELKNHIFPFRSYEHYWHDAWISLYAAKKGGLFFISDSLIKYRIHDDQLVGIGNGKTFMQPPKKSLLRRVYRRMQKMISENK